MTRPLWISLFTMGVLVANGPPATTGKPGGGTPGVTPPGAAEVRTLSERVPAGGTVQVKHLLTQPRPITSTGTRFATGGFQVAGVSVFSPSGDAAGAALVRNGVLDLAVISPDSDFGTSTDYPFLTITMKVPDLLPPSFTMPLQLFDIVCQGPSGPLTFVDPKPGTLTIGGSVSVGGMFPGGGTYPAGTVISVHGSGFVPGTKITGKIKMSNAVYVSDTEMQFTLQETTVMDMQPFQATNPDGSLVTFYSYQKGAPIAPPSRAILNDTEPVFQTQTHGIATVGPLPQFANGQFAALAIQNPGAGPVVVTLQLQSTGATATIVLPAGARVMDDVAKLLPGAAPGEVVNVIATSSVQILGIYADETAGTVTPFLPAF